MLCGQTGIYTPRYTVEYSSKGMFKILSLVAVNNVYN